MRHLKKLYREWQIKTGRRPLNSKILATGVLVEQYIDGTIKVYAKGQY